jgi:hypothetical protein
LAPLATASNAPATNAALIKCLTITITSLYVFP